MRGLPKIEPSRFIISMIVSREPARAQRLAGHARAELTLKLDQRVRRRRALGNGAASSRRAESRGQRDHRPDANR